MNKNAVQTQINLGKATISLLGEKLKVPTEPTFV